MYFTAENGNVGGFNEPVAAVGEGSEPFRSSCAILRRVEFDPKKLCRRDRNFISSLPKGVAIVGGFARGMYLGDMRDVGDLDLVIKRCEKQKDNEKLIKAISYFLSDEGYRTLYTFRMEQEFGHWDQVRSVLAVYDRYAEIKVNIAGNELAGLGILIRKLNSQPIQSRHFWDPRRTVDVLIALHEHELSDLLKLFDISVCQFAYLNGQLYATEAALEDVAKKIFHVLRDTDPERARRYLRKGYNMIWDTFADKVMRLQVFDPAVDKFIGKVVRTAE